MSKQEAAWILLAVCFAILALLVLVFYIFRRVKAKVSSKALLAIFFVFLVVSVGCGLKFYNEVYVCASCGDRVAYKTPLGRYCDDCFEKKTHKECSRCGNSVSSYVSKGGTVYCHNCAMVEFGLGYMYGYGE